MLGIMQNEYTPARVKNSNSHVRVERIRAAGGLSTRKWVWSVILPCFTVSQSHVYSKIIAVVKRLLVRKAEPKLMLRLHMDIDSLVRGKRTSVVRRTLPHRVAPKRMQGGCTFVNIVQFRCVGMQSPRGPVSTVGMEKHMQDHRGQGHLDSLREHHEPITCEETKVVTTADVLQEPFPALPVMDAAWADTVADKEVEVFGTEDTNSSEGFEDGDNLLNPHVISVTDLR